MTLLTPKSERKPEPWAIRFLAHALLGVFAWWSLIWAASPTDAVVIVAVVYFLGWEGTVQRFGAGVMDALTDSWAVTLGALTGLAILTTPLTTLRFGAWPFVAMVVLYGIPLSVGVWRRK